ncbi:MAG TPA: PAS domain S-box protein [Polyangiaceae bacterium]|nr:PAS domain S-box protein [Polyangiaceae bacterium]
MDETIDGAESATLRAERFARVLIETMPGVFYLYDEAGKFLRWNRNFEEISEYSADEIAGMHPLDFFAEEERELLLQRIGTVFTQGEASVEAPFLTKSGRKLPYFFTGKRVEFEGKTCLVGVGLDLSEQVRAHDALVRSEERFRTTLDHMMEGCQLLDHEMRYLYLNDAAAIHNRRSNDELIGRTMPDAWPGIESTRAFRLLARCLKERVPVHEEIDFVFPDGTSSWFDVRAQPVPDGIFVLSIDISERVAATRAVEESERRFRQLAASVEDAFWLADADLTQTLYVSPRHAQIWDRAPQELVAKPLAWLDAVHPEDSARVHASMKDYSQGTWTQTFRILHADRSVHWIRASSHPVNDADGKLQRLAFVSRDVTEYQNLDERFRQAQKMEALGRLAAGVAHDFNNILSVILSYSSLLLDDADISEQARADVQEIQRSGERAAELTHQLLALSRQQVLRPQLLEVGDVLANMKKMLLRVLGEDIELVLVSERSPGKVFADSGQLEQVLLNLAVNARDAMPDGGKLSIEVTRSELDEDYVALHPGVAAGTYVRVSVTDTGMGMSADTQSRIFEPFFTTKEEGKGTGLGLSTVFGIVQQSEGHISCYSELGIGTSFQIFLPVRTHAHRRVSSIPAPPSSLRGSELVLVVEDDAAVRETVSRVLTRNGYRTLLAGDGEEALAIMAAHPSAIELLITDVVMPRMNGRELARRLKQLKPSLSVLYLSGYTQHAAVQNGVLDEGVAFLQKPVTPEALLRKVREVLEETSPG